MEHIRDILSPYIDGALGDDERSRADKHLSSCAECRRALEDLRAVSKAVSALPKEPLPPGFLARLKERREAPVRAWLPAPARLAAFAAAGVVVAIVVRQETRLRREPFFAGEASVQTQEAREDARGPAAMEAGIQGKPQAKDLSRDYSNEELQRHLDDERKRLGIQEIAPKSAGASTEQPTLPDRPMSKDEAMEHVRSMGEQFARMNRQRRAMDAPPVALGAAAAPKMLSKPGDGGSPVDAGPASAAPAGSLSFMKSGGPVRGMAYESLELEEPEASPRSFSGSYRGTAPAQAAVIRGKNGLADLWKRAGMRGSAPALDFDREMAIAVFSAKDEGRPAILSVVADGSRLVVRYRVDAAAKVDAGAAGGYHVVVVPGSDLTPSFERTR